MKKRILLGILCVILVLIGVGVYSVNGDKISKNVFKYSYNIVNILLICHSQFYKMHYIIAIYSWYMTFFAL